MELCGGAEEGVLYAAVKLRRHHHCTGWAYSEALVRPRLAGWEGVEAATQASLGMALAVGYYQHASLGGIQHCCPRG